MNKASTWILVVIFLVYLVFTSGLYYWASGCKTTEKLITPYSLALSGEITGLTAVASQSDIDCINWLLEKGNEDLKISGDLNSNYLLVGYFPPYQEENTRILMLEQFQGEKHCYLLLTHQNMDSGILILADNHGEGLRVGHPFILTPNKLYYEVTVSTQSYKSECRVDNTTVVFRSGNSVVLEK